MRNCEKQHKIATGLDGITIGEESGMQENERANVTYFERTFPIFSITHNTLSLIYLKWSPLSKEKLFCIINIKL
jgi:hypothetical protein